MLHWGQLPLKTPVEMDQGRWLIELLLQRTKIPQDNSALAYILVPPGLILGKWWCMINSRERGQKKSNVQTELLHFILLEVGYKWMSLTFLQLVPCRKESWLNRILFFL